MCPKPYKLTGLVNARALQKIQAHLAQRVGATVLTVDENLRAAATPEGFCTACRLCFTPDGEFQLPLPADTLQRAAGEQNMPSPPCPAGLGFLGHPLLAGGVSLGSLLLGIVSDMQTFESRIFDLSRNLGERPREIATRYFNKTQPGQHDLEGYQEELEIAGATILGLATRAIADRPGANHLSFIENINRLIPHRSPLAEGMTVLLVHACTIFGADAAAFVFRKDQSSEAQIIPHNLSRHFVKNFLGNEALGGASYQVKHPLRLPALGGTFPWNHPLVATENIKSLVCVPMNAVEGHGMGLLHLFGCSHGQFEGVDLIQVGLLGREAMALWERVTLRESLEGRTKEVVAIQTLIRASGENLETTLQHFMDQATTLSKSQVCAVFLRQQGNLDLAATRSLNAGLLGEYELSSLGLLAKEADRTGHLLATDGLLAAGQAESTDRRRAPQHALKSVLAIPLKATEDNLGAIILGSTVTNSHTPDVVRTVQIVARTAAFALHHIQARQDLQRMHFEMVAALANAIEASYPYLGQHSVRVAKYALTMALSLGLSQQERDLIYQAGLLHDIGSLGIPRDLLTKPDVLSEEETLIIQTHSLRGFEIVSRVKGFEDMALMVKHHHERYDGKGYPDGLNGDAIPLGARILAVAEAFDAMTSKRPFRRALSLREALVELIQGVGTQFDRTVVSAFTQSLRRLEFQEAIRDNKEVQLPKEGLSEFAMELLANHVSEDRISVFSTVES